MSLPKRSSSRTMEELMRVLRLGEEDERLDAGELTVDVGDVLLVPGRFDRADAAQDEAGADGVGKVDGERVVGVTRTRGSLR